MSHKKYDSTVARIAGNIASGVKMIPVREAEDADRSDIEVAAILSVRLARAIIAEVERTEPEAQS